MLPKCDHSVRSERRRVSLPLIVMGSIPRTLTMDASSFHRILKQSGLKFHQKKDLFPRDHQRKFHEKIQTNEKRIRTNETLF